MKVETLKFWNVNAYLIEGDSGSILVDTANYNDRYKLYEKIKDKHVGLIILTHGHIDHIGGAKYISDKLNIPVAMSFLDLKLVKNNSCRQLYASSLVGHIIKFISEKSFKHANYEDLNISMDLRDGMIIEKYGLKCKIIELSGHTKGSIGVMVDDKVLFAGDAMMNIIRPTKARFYEDMATLNKSMDIINKINPKKIYPGHGPVITF